MDAQEIFDTVWNDMKAQNRRSFRKGVGCMYRGPFGTKCAAGHLIKDEEISSGMEGAVFGADSNPNTDEDIKWPKRLMAHKKLIKALQMCHDNSSAGRFWKDFSQAARAVAEDRNLTIPENNQ